MDAYIDDIDGTTRISIARHHTATRSNKELQRTQCIAQPIYTCIIPAKRLSLELSNNRTCPFKVTFLAEYSSFTRLSPLSVCLYMSLSYSILIHTFAY